MYTPSKWGMEFHAQTAHEVLGAGAAGPGKSWVLLMDPIGQLQMEMARMEGDPSIVGVEEGTPAWDTIMNNRIRPGESAGWALHLRRTHKMLQQTMVRAKKVFNAIEPGVRFESDSQTYVFACGFRYQFGHCQHSDDWDIYMSNEYTHIGFDELVQFEEEQYQQIITRLRTSDPILEQMLKIRAASNPLQRRRKDENFHVNDPHWVRRYFVEPAPQGRVVVTKKEVDKVTDEEFVRKRVYLPATIDDNPDPRFVRQYKATLMHAKPHIRKALLYGDWYVSAGSFYGDSWDTSIHTCKPFNIPNDWPVFRSMDWGFKKPGTVGWFALDEDGNMYGIRELTFKRQTAAQVAERIREIEEHMGLWGYGGSKITGPADTQLWEKRGETGKSKAEEMEELGVSWEPADKRSRQHNAERLEARLADHDDYTTTPGIVWFDTCAMSIRTIPAIQTDPNDVEVPMDGGEDHWHDMACYAVAYASHGRIAIQPPDESEYEIEPEEDYEERGQYGYGGY
jgi:hypothetical protein